MHNHSLDEIFNDWLKTSAHIINSILYIITLSERKHNDIRFGMCQAAVLAPVWVWQWPT